MIHTEHIYNPMDLILSSLDSLKYELYPSGSRYYKINIEESDYDFIMQEPETEVETWSVDFLKLGFWFLPLPSDDFLVKPLHLMRHALGIDIIVVKDVKTRWKAQQIIKKYDIFKRDIDFKIKNNRAFFLKFCLELLNSKLSNSELLNSELLKGNENA